jgi:tripartite-type tricarboxylate transporter receptor subunit TctC
VPVIVDNRPDAAAVMGATIVTKAKPDGSTLLLTDNSLLPEPGDPGLAALRHAERFHRHHHADAGAGDPDRASRRAGKTPAELLALAKKTHLTFASGGVGSSTHLMGVMVNLKAGTSITHVPSKSSGQALIALLGGHVSMQYGGLASAPPYMKDGKVRAIAITGDKRAPAVPDVPTSKEAGWKASRASGACMPRRGTSIEIRRAVRDAAAAVMRDPEVAKQLSDRGYQTIAGTPEEHPAQTNALVSQWIEVGKKVNLKE